MEDEFSIFLKDKINLTKRIGNSEAEDHYRYVYIAYLNHKISVYTKIRNSLLDDNVGCAI